MSPHSGRKMQSECSWSKAVRAASSTIWILIRPMSPANHASKTAQRKSPQASEGTEAGLTPRGVPGLRSTSGRKVTKAAPISRKKP